MSEIPSSPFIGLVPYSEEQAPFFFGREAESDLIIDNLRGARLTVLYGTSGVGKSSVLNAGAAYKLRQIAKESLTAYQVPEFVVVTLKNWSDDPVTGLLSKIQEAIVNTLQVKVREASPQDRNLSQMMGAWSKRYGVELLVILDQFEEYFIYHPNQRGAGTFAEEFPKAVNDVTLRARFLLSLRDDALSKLDFFKEQIPRLFDHLLRIEHMTSDAAKEAIVKPLEAYNELYLKDQPQEHYTIEVELVNEVLKQVAADEDEPKAEANGNSSSHNMRTIETPYLQMVMTRLWAKEREQGSHKLRLQTLSDLKGIKNIVQQHLNNALALLSEQQQGIAARIFDYLVTPSGTKIAYLKSDLAKKTKIPESELDAVLESLNRSRILRPVDPPPDKPDESRFEIFHDVLAQAALDWQKQYTQTAELLEAERKKLADVVEAQRAERAEALARRELVLRRMVGVLGIVLALAIGFAVYAWIQTNKATKAVELAGSATQQAIELNKLREIKSKELEINQASYDEFVKQYSSELSPEQRAQFDNAKKSAESVGPDNNITTIPTNLAPVPLWSKRWPNGKLLRVRFLDGETALQNKVARIASEWTKYTNLQFSFNDAPDAELRVSFAEPGSWSYVGTDALNIPQSEPTINLGILKEAIDEATFRRTVLHEFGHVFGLIHEHQNPNANIPWNKIAVYRFFAGPPYHWNAEIVDDSVLNRYSGDYREFDPKSVMMFIPIPKEFLIGDSVAPITELSTELSESDKTFVGKIYPKD